MSGKKQKLFRQQHGISVQAKREEREFEKVIDLAAHRARARIEFERVESGRNVRKLMAYALLALIIGCIVAAVIG